MRYLIAMLIAIPVALLATLYVSSPFASWVTGLYTYDNPDSVADMHAMAFMACNLAGLVVGWIVGWWIGGLMFPRRNEA